MFSNILITTDLSKDSDELIRCVSGLYKLGCRKAHLVYGLEMDNIMTLKKDIGLLVQKEIDKQVEVLNSSGIECAGHFIMNPLQTEIERTASENDCSLIVSGSPVHSFAKEIISGGMAAVVLNTTKRPVLMLRLHKSEASDAPSCVCWPCKPVGHLLFPTDFSENADHVFQFLKTFITECRPEKITLLHVQEKDKISPHLENRLHEFNETDTKRLSDFQNEIASVFPECTADIKVILGHPAEQIVRFCEEKDVSLVVMGTHGRGLINELFSGSVSHNVARRSPVPVMLIPMNINNYRRNK